MEESKFLVGKSKMYRYYVYLICFGGMWKNHEIYWTDSCNHCYAC